MRLLLLFALIVGSVSNTWAESYTITFKKGSGDGTSASTSTACSAIVSDGATYLSGNLVTATSVYYSGSNRLKLGTSSGAGVIKMSLASNVKPTSIVVNAKRYNSSKAVTIAVNSKTAQSLTEDFANYTFTFDGNTEISFIQLNSSKYCWVSSVTVNYSAAGTTAPPTITGDATFLGTTTVTITNAASADGADIYYTLNGDDPTTTTSGTCFEYSVPFEISATTTVKAIAKKSTDTNASSVVSKTFTKVSPMTVTAALTAIDALADNGTIADQCVTGIVSTAGSLNSGAITYKVSVDGTTTNELQVYKGKGLNGANFENASDIAVGDVVVIYGTLKNFNGTTPEFDQGNYLLSKYRKPAPTFSLDITEKTLQAYGDKTVDVTLTTNTDGEITCESNHEDVATVALKNGKVYTITAQSEGTATITIRSAASENYASASATVAITVQDNRANASISFAENEIAKTWGESFTGQELTNTNSVAVTWSSTDETVATVNSTGVVNVLKAGETTIKATFAGNATYKADVASYNLTVNKANAGISYAETTFDIMLNDASFVAPTLQNPNGLTGITYSSNNETVADVDENTGELSYVETATGTAKITASFAGNDWYKSGSANYTINIVDPTVKGSKYNPYTVAEVIALNPTSTSSAVKTDVYVIGYIAGSCNTSTGALITDPTKVGNTNLALVDEPDDTSDNISIQLSEGTNRTNYNVKNHPYMMGVTRILIKGDVFKYCGIPGLKNIDEMKAVAEAITVTNAGYATYASDFGLDYSGIDVKAYQATVSGTDITFNKVTEVPAGEGVLLQNEGTFVVPVKSVAAWADNANAFVRGTGAAVASGDGPYNYILNKVGGVVGFYKANDQTVAANRAYLQSTTNKARIGLSFDDETTGIESVDVNTENANVAREYYNLNGQRVANPSKGLYIVNGKKVIIK